ARPADNRQVH
ncbi:sulfatase family protein, partial [Vibrio parahaemolyticus IDH02640]